MVASSSILGFLERGGLVSLTSVLRVVVVFGEMFEWVFLCLVVES